ncbi:MAG: GWxTD domain-containing protein [Gemmatimonadales bacterium]
MIALAVVALVLQIPARTDSLLAAGRAHFAGRLVGRYAALAAFRAASRLAPNDPEPLYWQMKVGFYLGSDEGDGIARQAILRILTLDPEYADVWDRFHELYQSPDVWRRAERALAAHPTDPRALEFRAGLAIALEQPQRADSLLERLVQLREPAVGSTMLRAEAAFLAGNDSAGERWYAAALAHADADTSGALWDRVWMIGSPQEAAEYEATPMEGRRAFFERFWARRDPNLLTAGNERLGEHFRRFAYARRYFRLLHPLNLYHRSAVYRTLVLSFDRSFAEENALHPGEPYAGADNDKTFAPGEGTASALAGVDARGLIYLRHGTPDRLLRGTFDPLHPFDERGDPLDVEGWLYHTADGGTLTLGFKRGTSPGAGDFVFMPSNRRQTASTRLALRTDRSALPAPLAPRVWSAAFRSAEVGRTDMYYRVNGDTAAAALWDAFGHTQSLPARGSNLLRLTVPPGDYDLGLDVDSAGVLGRLRRGVAIPGFSPEELSLSSLLIAPSSELLDRETTLRRMPLDLGYSAGGPLASFVEIYGLALGGDARTRYRLAYSFAPVRAFPARLFSGSRPVVFEFDREGTSSTAIEQLIIEPGRVPAGRYRVTLVVTDRTRNVKSESAALEIDIR